MFQRDIFLILSFKTRFFHFSKKKKTEPGLPKLFVSMDGVIAVRSTRIWLEGFFFLSNNKIMEQIENEQEKIVLILNFKF